MLEELGVLAWGVVLGVAIAAPIGPIGLLCIRRTVERGLAAGFATGAGSALVDAFFAAVAAFGVSRIVDALTGHAGELRLVGGLFLLGAAAHGLVSQPRPPAEEPVRLGRRGLLGAVGGGVLLTVTNPVTIMGIIAIVVGFGGAKDTADATALTLGVLLGSLLWWALLCGGFALVRHRFTLGAARWINRGTAVVLGALGVWALAGAARMV